MLDGAAACGLAVVRTSEQMLGALLTADFEMTQRWAMEKVDSHADFFRLLQHPLVPHASRDQLLRMCGIPRMNYVMRTHAPATLEMAAPRFDANIREAHSQAPLLATLGADSDMLATFHAPARSGGGGYRPTDFVAPLAFVASLAQAAQDIAETMLAHPEAPQNAELDATYESIRRHGVPLDALHLPSRDRFWQTFRDPAALPPHFQKLLDRARTGR